MSNTHSTEEILAFLGELVSGLAHNKLLNISVVDFDVGKLTLSLPYSSDIVGNPDTGVIHGGALTTLLDNACGFAAISSVAHISSGVCPTLDLRIDYMQAATPDKAVIGSAETYRVTNNVIFVRGIAYHEGEQDTPIAHCTATFMRMKPKID
ncbi:MAG: PaaI family thioesterase [Pseudomonadota bacterium]